VNSSLSDFQLLTLRSYRPPGNRFFLPTASGFYRSPWTFYLLPTGFILSWVTCL